MLKSLKKVMVGMLGATFLIGALAPVSAAPTMLSAPAVANENLQQVRDHRWGGGDRHWGGHRPGYRPGWQGRPGYWNGHRGYRYYRHGYRRHSDGWWYPLAAFGAGAIIGGALAAPPPPPPPVYPAPAYRYSNAHIQWCYNRYKSYRASDNTFQPYNGPRQQCYSPY
ncbi:BA14K family protein [Brucella sp. 6810]|uniref:BA14K family protein n=1 Tax=Brucella sp. 6810 TaxID=2769351 RepID=UPI00165BE521|nr:BA14K family protein [Brucella sp. 6810]QNQ64357.1 BA14K family protein [Brucella sp. 6810]